jgi:hypothetical protein
MSRSRALPYWPSVRIPACAPLSEIAWPPSSATAIAVSATEIASPTESSTSSSRSGGRTDIWWAIADSSSVALPIADSTATTPRPSR